MLNPWLAITFQTMRLGFEAQNAMTLRLMRLVGDVSKTEVRRTIADTADAPPDAQEAATKVASNSDRRRVTKVNKKRVFANKRRRSNKSHSEIHLFNSLSRRSSVLIFPSATNSIGGGNASKAPIPRPRGRCRCLVRPASN